MTKELTLQRALGLADEGRWEEAAKLLHEVLEDGEDADVLCSLAVAERELGEEGVAYDLFKRALALAPEDPLLLTIAGAGIAHFDDPEAEAALRTAALLAPQMAHVRWMYGAYLSREGHDEDAMGHLNAAVEMDPDDEGARFERGVAHALAGRLEAALDDFDGASRLDPEDSWVRVLSGLALSELGRDEEAAGELLEAARRRPEDLEAQLIAALSSAAVGREDLGLEMLERARLGAGAEDRLLVEEVEERLDAGADEARGALARTFRPIAFRARLMLRP